METKLAREVRLLKALALIVGFAFDGALPRRVCTCKLRFDEIEVGWINVAAPDGHAEQFEEDQTDAIAVWPESMAAAMAARPARASPRP